MASADAMESLDLDGKAPGTDGQPAAEGAYSGLLDGLRQRPKQLPCRCWSSHHDFCTLPSDGIFSSRLSAPDRLLNTPRRSVVANCDSRWARLVQSAASGTTTHMGC